jgi:nitroimidazol reductase NimA-like FMN-containing flavoprotein (pyridoxamine 5'-phosphate oxidase superfamily)
MALSRDLALTDEEQDEILREEWNMRIATVSPSGRVNLTPLWYVWHAGKVWTYCRGQKVENLRRDPRCTVLVDRNEKFPELQGIMIQGDARILEDVAAEEAEPELAEVRRIYGHKYNGGHGQPAVDDPPPMAASVRGRNGRWVVVTPVSVVTWDNHKLRR